MSAPRLSLAYPRLWRPTTVPTFPVTLDRSHPLARGLALCIVPGSSRGAVDFVGGLAPVVSGAGGLSAGVYGPGYVTNITGALGYRQAVAPPVFSMEVLVQSGTPGTRNEFICGWDSAAGGGGGLNDRSINGFGAGVTGSFEGYIFPGSAVTVVGGTSYFAGLISHVVLTSDGTTLALYVNGVSVASTAAGNAYAGYSSPSYFVVGSNDRTSWPWSGTIHLANLATVAWTSGEIAARYAEPFGMFRPIVRRAYFVGAVASGLTTTAAIVAGSTATLRGVGNLTSTAAVVASTATTLRGTGALTTTAAIAAASTATLRATGALTTTAAAVASSTATLTAGPGALTSTAAVVAASTATLTGTGALTTTAPIVAASTSTLSSAGSIGALTTTAAITTGATATLSGIGRLISTSAIVTTSTASLSLPGAMRTTAAIVAGTTSTLTGIGALTTIATIQANANARLAPHSSAYFAWKQRAASMPVQAPMVDQATGLITPMWSNWLQSIIRLP